MTDAHTLLAETLGKDWELVLVRARAAAGPDATEADIQAAAERAIALAEERFPGLTAEQAQGLREAWMQQWRQLLGPSDREGVGG